MSYYTFTIKQDVRNSETEKDILQTRKLFHLLGKIIATAPKHQEYQQNGAKRRITLSRLYFSFVITVYALLVLYNILVFVLSATFINVIFKAIGASSATLLRIVLISAASDILLTTLHGPSIQREFYRKMYRRNLKCCLYAFISALLRSIILIVVFKLEIPQLVWTFSSTLVKLYLVFTFVISASDIRLRFEKINAIIGDIPKKDVSQLLVNKDAKSIKGITDKLYHLCRMHYNLCYLLRELNKTFTFQLLCSLACSLALILFHSYFLYHILVNEARTITAIKIICPVVWLTNEAVEIYLLVNASAGTCESANSTAIYIHELRNECFNMDIESHIQMYSLQLLHQKIHVSAMGFFNIDYSLIYSIIGAVTTYMVIFIQFDQSLVESSIDSFTNGNCSKKV